MNEWNLSDFSSFLDQQKSGLAYLYTPMCGTCQLASKMLQVVEELVEIEIGKMNLNYYAELAERYKVESVPCLLFIENGEVKDMMYAFQSVPYLLDRIKQVLE
ncbi:thioredoxin family protein [Bacillus sp. BRMEA1]|uniref:thioredoxin family protein n=1 Tax=Neobacillus endophyticus TaxID=2738405 RepID=UPI00156504E7|nr:thioredoxin family protein [Neobacillus endophyticus]NRD76424.1 thioredoxin family protein [Neobacillus endophyticus]